MFGKVLDPEKVIENTIFSIFILMEVLKNHKNKIIIKMRNLFLVISVYSIYFLNMIGIIKRNRLCMILQ